MTQFKVVKPVSFAEDGKGRSARPGAVIEISDAVAKDLGDRVEKVDGNSPKPDPKRPVPEQKPAE